MLPVRPSGRRARSRRDRAQQCRSAEVANGNPTASSGRAPLPASRTRSPAGGGIDEPTGGAGEIQEAGRRRRRASEARDLRAERSRAFGRTRAAGRNRVDAELACRHTDGSRGACSRSSR